jgi:hypothetical protein
MSVGEHVDLEPASSHRPGTNGRPGRATRQRPTAPAHTVGASAEAHDAYAFPPHPSSTARLRALLGLPGPVAAAPPRASGAEHRRS